MDQQLTFADSEFNNKRRQTRKEKLLGRVDKLILWARLEDVIELHYLKAGNGHRPYPSSSMLRTHCMQQCIALVIRPWKTHCTRLFKCDCLRGGRWISHP